MSVYQKIYWLSCGWTATLPISSPYLCLLCSQYSILDDLLLFANEQVSVCVGKLGSPVRLSVKANGTATLGRSAQFYTVFLWALQGRYGFELNWVFCPERLQVLKFPSSQFSKFQNSQVPKFPRSQVLNFQVVGFTRAIWFWA